MKLYLITGFLGAGKTTFLKHFMTLFQGQRLHLIINEFGKAGVDGTLLQEMNVALSEINNGSIFCACKLEDFEKELKNAIKERPDVILVECSGLTDPTNVEKVLQREQLSSLEYCGSICLVDVPRFEKVVSTARVCAKQLKISSVALLNKIDLSTTEQIKEVTQQIREINPMIRCHETTNGVFQKEWLKEVSPKVALEEGQLTPDLTLQKALVTISPEMNITQLKGFLGMVLEDTWRIKGFVNLQGDKLLVDCVGSSVNAVPFDGNQHVDYNQLVFLAGSKMPLRKSLNKAASWYKNYILKIER